MASGQEVRYVVYVDGMGRVVSGFQQGEAAANSFEKSVSGLNSTFKEFALAGGIAFGLSAIVSAGKEWMQTSADLEQSFIRIQNASKSAGEGIKNQLFINEEVDKYKLNLQEASESWGKFIFRIKNANLSGDMQRHIEDEMLAISKVAALPASEMDRLTYNVGTMLAEGVMDARHLRGIANVHPQLLPYLAEALGLKDNEKTQFSKLLKGEEFNLNQQQQLFRLISSGKLTKEGIKSDYLLTALDKYYKDAVTPDKLATSLTSIQSSINDVDNAWLRMKEDIVVELKPELVELFTDIKDGAHWIRENKDEIIFLGKEVVKLAEFIIAAKIAWGGYNLILQTGAAWKDGYASKTAIAGIAIEKETLAVDKEVIAANVLTTSLTAATNQMDLFTSAQIANAAATERLVEEYVQLDMFSPDPFRGFGTSGAGSHGALNKYRHSKYASSAEEAAIQGSLFSESELAATGLRSTEEESLAADMITTGSITTILTSAIPIAFGLVTAGYFLNKLGEWFNHAQGTDKMIGTGAIAMAGGGEWEMVEDLTSRDHFKWQKVNNSKTQSSLPDLTYHPDFEKKWIGKEKKAENKTLTKDHITGQQVIHYHILDHGTINGQKDCHFELGSIDEFNMQDFGRHLSQTAQAVVIAVQRNGDEQ